MGLRRVQMNCALIEYVTATKNKTKKALPPPLPTLNSLPIQVLSLCSEICFSSSILKHSYLC